MVEYYSKCFNKSKHKNPLDNNSRGFFMFIPEVAFIWYNFIMGLICINAYICYILIGIVNNIYYIIILSILFKRMVKYEKNYRKY